MGNCQAQGGNFAEASQTFNADSKDQENKDNFSFNPAQVHKILTLHNLIGKY
jgi:hypothetical protein